MVKKRTAKLMDAQLLANMQALRDKIAARRKGKPIPTDIVEQVRAERDDELLAGIT
jgi:hypothetical protein